MSYADDTILLFSAETDSQLYEFAHFCDLIMIKKTTIKA